MSEKSDLKTIYGNYIIDGGFVPVSNILIDHRDKLGITESEFIFIIIALRYTSGFTLNNDIFPYCDKKIREMRKSLHDKGFLEFEVKTSRKSDGTFATIGSSYNFSGLNKALQELFSTVGNETSENSKEEPCGKKVQPDGKKVSSYGKKDTAYNKTINKTINKTNLSTSAPQKSILTEVLDKSRDTITEYYEKVKEKITDKNKTTIELFIKSFSSKKHVDNFIESASYMEFLTVEQLCAGLSDFMIRTIQEVENKPKKKFYPNSLSFLNGSAMEMLESFITGIPLDIEEQET